MAGVTGECAGDLMCSGHAVAWCSHVLVYDHGPRPVAHPRMPSPACHGIGGPLYMDMYGKQLLRCAVPSVLKIVGAFTDAAGRLR